MLIPPALTAMPFEAVLFDCDGVLVDSEPLTNGVLCAMLNEAGWPISSEECMATFIGKTVRSEAARIEAHTGRPLTDAWMDEFYARRNVQIERHLQPIAGAIDAVRSAGRTACALSGGGRYRHRRHCRRGRRCHGGGLQPLARGPWHARGAARGGRRACAAGHGWAASVARLSTAALRWALTHHFSKGSWCNDAHSKSAALPLGSCWPPRGRRPCRWPI